MGEVKLIPVYYMSTGTGWGCACLHTRVRKVSTVKNFLTHYLVLSPGLLFVDIAVLDVYFA